MAILTCECGKEIVDFSVCVEDKSYRTDYSMYSKDQYFRNDREYFEGDVSEVIYKCDCSKEIHKQRVVSKKHVKHLNDFIRDINHGHELNLDKDLKHENYGPISISK